MHQVKTEKKALVAYRFPYYCASLSYSIKAVMYSQAELKLPFTKLPIVEAKIGSHSLAL